MFSSQASGAGGSLFWQAADGTGTAERLTQSSVNFSSRRRSRRTAHASCSRKAAGSTQADVMMLTLDKDRRVQPLVQTPSAERNGEISPDGRWLAYQSNDSGQVQIYVRPFPDVNNGQWQVSTDGGTQPLWARNGQELSTSRRMARS